LLVPPLEDNCPGNFRSKTGEVSTSNSIARSVMSQGLQDKFGAMEQVWAQSRTLAAISESSPSEAVASAAAAASASEQEDSQQQQQRESKKRKVAMDTAFAIESEVQKWQRGIAELEAMLEAANGDVEDFQGSSSSLSEGEARALRPEVVRFPSLPPIIPAEEGDFEGSEEDDDDNEDDESEMSKHYNAIDKGSE